MASSKGVEWVIPDEDLEILMNLSGVLSVGILYKDPKGKIA